MKNARATAVYVMQAAHGAVKIGRSHQPERRLRQLMSAGGTVLHLRHATAMLDDASLVEAIAHQLLADKRLSGEWFDVTPEQAIDAIQSAFAEIEKRRERAKCKCCKPDRVKFPTVHGEAWKDARLDMRVSSELKQALERLAAQDRRRLTDLVEIVLEDYVQARTKKAAKT